MIRVRVAEPERTNGKRAPGPTKSDAGARVVVLPPFLRKEVRRHLDWFVEKGPDGLVFVGEKGAAFRRTTFGWKWRRAREVAGLPDGFRFYDLRHTGHTLSTRSGATLRDTMVRAGQSSEKEALIYQHSDEERQREVATGLDEPRARRACEAPHRRRPCAPQGGAVGGLMVRLWCGARSPVRTTENPRADDLGVSHGAGDENRTRALSLGSDGA
ncbi:hypothetical protein [Streptomyces sp. NPDC057238]|uniref:hypothetical protein n=1 Tax=Streptomyces sp. NPDC057238 TaxID=3346060 RepID=UPI0036279FB6